MIRVVGRAVCLALLFVASGCTLTRSIVPGPTEPEVSGFLNQTNLVYSNDKYWIKDVPEPESALGTVYERLEKRIGDKTFEAFRYNNVSLFGALTDANVRKSGLLFNQTYTFKGSDEGSIAVLSVFTGSASNVVEIQRKVELTQVWQLTLSNATFDRTYCASKYFYVTRLWLGASSDFGLQEAKYQMAVAGVSVGTALSGSEKSSLHTVKQGALAFTLEPVGELAACKAPMNTPPPQTNVKPMTDDELKALLIKQNFKATPR